MRHRCKPAMLAATLLFAAPAFTDPLSDDVPPSDKDILWWMVDNSATVSEGGSGDPVNMAAFITSQAEGAFSGSDYFGARVRVTGGDISSDVFLDIYWFEPELGKYVLDEGNGYLGADFYEGNGFWGAGVPTGAPSPSGEYHNGTPEYSFIVEIGAITFDEGTLTGEWTTIATSETETYSALLSHMRAGDTMLPPAAGAWVPQTFTAVPEPTSGLMTALGLALLALRRRRR